MVTCSRKHSGTCTILKLRNGSYQYLFNPLKPVYYSVHWKLVINLRLVLRERTCCKESRHFMRSRWLWMIEARTLEVFANEHPLHTSIAKYSNLLVVWYLTLMINTSTPGSNKPRVGCHSSRWGDGILMDGSSVVLWEVGGAPVSYSQQSPVLPTL